MIQDCGTRDHDKQHTPMSHFHSFHRSHLMRFWEWLLLLFLAVCVKALLSSSQFRHRRRGILFLGCRRGFDLHFATMSSPPQPLNELFHRSEHRRGHRGFRCHDFRVRRRIRLFDWR